MEGIFEWLIAARKFYMKIF